jgi:DNA-binding transcriptional ArsR family regulator
MAGQKRGKRRRNKNHALVTALRHPLRRAILKRMSDGRKASPSELAEELDETLSNVAYHVRVLAKSRALKPVSRRQVRGATQHFYRWSLKAKWAQAMLEEDEE